MLHEHNIWIYGEHGYGKSGWYVDYFTDNGGYYLKDKNKYWNGYQGEPNVIINDVEKDEKFMLGYLKRWGEHLPFAAEDKYGAFRKIRPNHIVVTSNFRPQDIFDEVDIPPLLRRFKLVKLVMPYRPQGHENYNPELRASTFLPGQAQEPAEAQE